MRARLVAFAIALLLVVLPGRAFARPIQLWHAYRGDEERALAEVVATWNQGPVDVLALPYDAFASKLAASIPLGEGPDLFIDAHERLGDFRARSIVAPAGDAFEEGAFHPLAVAAVSTGATHWAIPLSEKCLALYVNTRLAPPPRTLDEIAVAELPPGVFPLAYEVRSAYAHAALLGAFGGELLDSRDAFAFVGPAAERSIDLVRGLLARHVVPDDADNALVTSLFKSGRAAYAIAGPSLAADLGGSAISYRVVPLPFVREAGARMRPLLTIESVMLSPTGASRPEVRALARLLSGHAAGAIRARLARTVSARIDTPPPSNDAMLQAFANQARHATPMPSSPAMRSAWEPARRALVKALQGDAPPAVALEEAKRRFDDVRRPLPPASSPIPLLLGIGALGLFAALRWTRAAAADGFRERLRSSLPAYRYVVHAVVVVGLVVVLPLAIGAATALFAGQNEQRRYVGVANFVAILTARGGPLFASGSFYLVLAVTVLWTVVNVALHVAIGLGLGLVLARPTLRLRGFYRVLLVVPWAVPSYVTALAWKGVFHRQFGAVTGLILAVDRWFGLSLEPIAWFARFSTAFTANVATNVWLGFPFMMVVTLGALTAVPADVLEAARVDGASRWQRLRLVTLPMIRPTLAPAVTLGAVWTFNMFNVVFLVSGGDPDGTTDILVSEAYRWAFTREAQYGYAAAYAVLIFVLLFGATRAPWSRRRAPAPAADPTLEAA